MQVVTVIGARPQFIKAAPVCKVLSNKDYKETLIHTGQHFDKNMSAIFFNEMEIPEPSYNLGVGSGSHAWQTGQIMLRLEELLINHCPDYILVYGDTNSTIAAALVACKLRIPLAHIEAGLRSFNRDMPEEHNRVLTDHCSDYLFCPTQTAVINLAKEGIKSKVYLVGDTMYDAVLQFAEIAKQRSKILQKLNLSPGEYLLVTMHRPHNTDNPVNFKNVINALMQVKETVIFPVHPRTSKKMIEFGINIKQISGSNIRLIEPVGYLDMLMLEQNARLILTDSGGIQKESFFFGIPCITLRSETEWVETVESGWNVLVGADSDKILENINKKFWPDMMPSLLFGDGNASSKIVRLLS